MELTLLGAPLYVPLAQLVLIALILNKQLLLLVRSDIMPLLVLQNAEYVRQESRVAIPGLLVHAQLDIIQKMVMALAQHVARDIIALILHLV